MKKNKYTFDKWKDIWFPITVEAKTYEEAVEVVNQFLKKQYKL